MILFPNCKINLGLHITRRREDGYHDLETVFYPLHLRDALEAVITGTDTGIRFDLTGIPVEGEAGNNLCVKAYHLLQQDFPSLPAVHMHLHKSIPMGAGLGGGSADGAFALVLLNRLLHLGLTATQLENYALQLGSDCPFFIGNKPCYATGRGEIMEELALDLSDYTILVVHPGIHISTAEAFAGIDPKQPARPLKELIHTPVAEWKHCLQNDFESSITRKYPLIGELKEQLYAAGAVYASMSGSGSCLYGLFDKQHGPVPNLSFAYPTWLIE